jgi:hypothetical protein
LNVFHQHRITLRTDAALRRTMLTGNVTPLRRRGDLQDVADRLDPEAVAVGVNELPDDV